MARQGVTYSEVAEAASELIGKGKNPTIEQVRLILGTGSSTTIAAHLKVWKENQNETSLISAKENIPEELIAIVKGLWERVINISNEKVNVITAQYHASIDDLQSDLDKYRHNNQRWQHLYNNWNKEKDALLTENKRLELELQQYKDDFSILKSQYDASINQVIDKQDRVNELTILYQQSQKSINHIQANSQEQRRVDQQQYQEQKELLQTEVKKLEIAISKLNALNEAAHLEKEKLKTDISKLISEAAILHANLSARDEQISRLDKDKQEYLQSYQHWKTQSKLLENDIRHLQSDITEKLNDISDLKQIIKDSQSKINQLQDTNHYINAEKAALENRIKHWEIKEGLIPA